MPEYQDENEEIKDLLKRKVKLAKDSHRLGDLGDVLFRIGYLYYQKGYYSEALNEFESALEVRKKLTSNLDIATTHRFLGETLCKLATDFDRSKTELDIYYSMTLRLKDLVEIQRAQTTLGNYYMALYESNYKDNKKMHLNEAYSYYLKSYDILNEIADKNLVDAKEFGLMKARTCLNCAFAMDEKRDLIICNEYLKAAIDICEKYHFYEDLIRCYYIKCDQARRKNKMEEMLRIADKLVEITCKSKDSVQQSNDFLFVAEIYLKIQNFEKAKTLLRKAYKLRKKCLISQEITTKLKQVIEVIHLQRDLNAIDTDLVDSNIINIDMNKCSKVLKIYEKLGDNLCNLGLYEPGLKNYQKQLEFSKKLNRPNNELALIYSSLAQTCQDLDNLKQALEYYDLEMKTNSMDCESECKSLLNIAVIKEKLTVEFVELKETYMKAYKKAKEIPNNEISLKYQLKAMNLLKETEVAYSIEQTDTQRIINSLNDIMKIRNLEFNDDEETKSEKGQAENENEEDDEESILFSSESEEDEIVEEELEIKITNKSKVKPKRYVVKRNLRGETHLHVACIKGNFKMAKKLLEEGHPVNERDNLNWLPIHEACNYGHVELVELLIKYGAKVNDHIGPITPLHDASQNGHFEVVKLLLKAGAMPYVFSQEGYTPLDFLCYYKESNLEKLSSNDLELFKEIYDIMLTNIRAKDKMYKIKKVVETEDNVVVEEKEQDEELKMAKTSKPSEKSTNRKKTINYGLDDLSDGESNSSESDRDMPKIKKKKAVSEYKAAINSFGSKSSTGTHTIGSSGGKKAIDKVIVSETEYNINVNDWLINDMESKKTNNKRKLKDNNSSIDDDLSNLTFEDVVDNMDDENAYINEIIEHSTKSKKKLNQSPDSKRRNVESENLITNKRLKDIYEDNDSQSSTSSVFSIHNNKVNESKLKKTKENSKSLDILSDNENDIIFNKENDFRIKSPFKNVSNKTQQKLTKMLNCTTNTAKPTLKDQSPEIIEVSKKTETKPKTSAESDISKTSWKIKATIDNRNFLIPVSNIYATIDNLTEQIVTRYKTIFSNDPQYREPEKVILKSSDDLILFGADLIIDVLADQCQVKLMIESYKDAPSMSELYELTCKSNNLICYSNVKQKLKDSDACFDLKSISIDSAAMAKQFEIIIEVIKMSSKQQFVNSDYFVNLNKIDLSCNMFNDQIIISFIEAIFPECVSLKSLNFSFNQISYKSLKALCDVTNRISSKTIPLEYLNLNGNDLSCFNSNSDFIFVLNNILTVFQTLKSINLSDCKFSVNEITQTNQISWKRFLTTIKSSKLTEIDLSYNSFSPKYLTELIESLPDYKIEHININNCVKKANNWDAFDLIEALNKFIGFNLKSLSLRNLNMSLDQTNLLIRQLCKTTKELKKLDISYSSFEYGSLESLFSECLKLEEVSLINNEKSDLNWPDLVRFKFENASSVPLRRIEVKLNYLSEKTDLRNIFKNKWQKNSIKTYCSSKRVCEIKVDY